MWLLIEAQRPWLTMPRSLFVVTDLKCKTTLKQYCLPFVTTSPVLIFNPTCCLSYEKFQLLIIYLPTCNIRDVGIESGWGPLNHAVSKSREPFKK